MDAAEKDLRGIGRVNREGVRVPAVDVRHSGILERPGGAAIC